MMDYKKFKDLVNKLDKYLIHHGDGLSPSLSHLQKDFPGLFCSPGKLYSNMDMEQLCHDELMMIHTNLHRFYPRGNLDVNKTDIEQLHNKVKKLINHKNFDWLDKVDKDEK